MGRREWVRWDTPFNQYIDYGVSHLGVINYSYMGGIFPPPLLGIYMAQKPAKIYAPEVAGVSHLGFLSVYIYTQKTPVGYATVYRYQKPAKIYEPGVTGASHLSFIYINTFNSENPSGIRQLIDID